MLRRWNEEANCGVGKIGRKSYLKHSTANEKNLGIVASEVKNANIMQNITSIKNNTYGMPGKNVLKNYAASELLITIVPKLRAGA
ncbi:hypothetical protein TNCV_970681 [Trichonephila clavipes]|nr:hypothetical protein TNCV_970681 [Trichonephila clavipes]